MHTYGEKVISVLRVSVCCILVVWLVEEMSCGWCGVFGCGCGEKRKGAMIRKYQIPPRCSYFSTDTCKYNMKSL